MVGGWSPTILLHSIVDCFSDLGKSWMLVSAQMVIGYRYQLWLGNVYSEMCFEVILCSTLSVLFCSNLKSVILSN